MQKSLASNVFQPWKDGNNTENIRVGNPDGQPFVVRVSDNHWLPVNVLVFAASKEEAISIIRKGLNDSREIALARQENEKGNPLASQDINRVDLIIKLMEDQNNIEVEPFDKTYVSKVAWGTSGIC
jgi:hypothetical protein